MCFFYNATGRECKSPCRALFLPPLLCWVVGCVKRNAFRQMCSVHCYAGLKVGQSKQRSLKLVRDREQTAISSGLLAVKNLNCRHGECLTLDDVLYVVHKYFEDALGVKSTTVTYRFPTRSCGRYGICIPRFAWLCTAVPSTVRTIVFGLLLSKLPTICHGTGVTMVILVQVLSYRQSRTSILTS